MAINLEECQGQLATFIEHSLACDTSKLSNLTCEEMFYLSKVLAYQVVPGKVNGFMVSLKVNALRWTKDKRLKPALPWDWMSRQWQDEFLELVGSHEVH